MLVFVEKKRIEVDLYKKCSHGHFSRNGKALMEHI